MRVLNLVALPLVTLLSNRCACCYKMALNLSWMITFLQPFLDNPDYEAELHAKFPLQLPPSPATNDPCLPIVFVTALTHVKPACLRVGRSCNSLSTPPAAATALRKTGIQAVNLL